MEFKGKTVEEATKIGLEIMSLDEDSALITIKQAPTKGLFGRLKGEAIVEIEKKSVLKREQATSQETNQVEETTEKEELSKESLQGAKEFLEEILTKLDVNAEIEISNNGENDVFTLNANNSASIIGYRGEVLDALQTLVSAKANIGSKSYKKVVVDCEGYREKREDTLVSLAKKLEAKATEMKREVILEPMNPFERRIIHTTLASSETVTTTSKGSEPNRYVVIVPNEKDEYSKPYNAGRNNFGARRKEKKVNKKSGYTKSSNYGKSSSSAKPKTFSNFGTYLGNRFKDDN